MPTNWTPESSLAKAVDLAGFRYDPDQDIIYSKFDAWQRATGFCHMYDEAAPATISAVIDCEPIRFLSGGKQWMIELWKGQYGIETGAEIGVYNLAPPKPIPLPKLEEVAKSLPGPFAGFFLEKARAADAAARKAVDQGAALMRTTYVAVAMR